MLPTILTGMGFGISWECLYQCDAYFGVGASLFEIVISPPNSPDSVVGVFVRHLQSLLEQSEVEINTRSHSAFGVRSLEP